METYYEDCAGKTLRLKLIFPNSTQKKVSYLGENPISFEKKTFSTVILTPKSWIMAFFTPITHEKN